MTSLILYIAAVAAISALFAEAASALSPVAGAVRPTVLGAHLFASAAVGFLLAWGML